MEEGRVFMHQLELALEFTHIAFWQLMEFHFLLLQMIYIN